MPSATSSTAPSHSLVKNFSGKVPQGEIDPAVTARIEQTQHEVEASLEEYEFKKAADSIMSLADYGNIYFQSHEPWKLVQGRRRLGAVVRGCLQIAKALVLFMQPFMPSKMQSAWRQLGMPGDVADMRFWRASVPLSESAPLEQAGDTLLQAGGCSRQGAGRHIPGEDKEGGSGGQGPGEKAEIPYEHFEALDIRIGEVKEASCIKGSNKLLKLMVDIEARRARWWRESPAPTSRGWWEPRLWSWSTSSLPGSLA